MAQSFDQCSQDEHLHLVKITKLRNGNCIEVPTTANGLVAVRDSKDLPGPIFCFTSGEWQAFLRGVKDGKFDRPTRANPAAYL